MKRIFYYSGYSLDVFHWNNDICIASFTFNPDDNGLEKFTVYLKATANTPARMLVDLIDEDFNKETIPHVGTADRKLIVNRLINRQYRKSRDYFYYRVTGREKSGRKDDKLLYCVLSNPDILKPWLDIIQETKTSISGIWSLALLNEYVFSHIQSTAKHTLIVSQQVAGNLRQTLLTNGRFEHSRSAAVNLDGSDIGEFISTEIEQTIRFLSNQRYIGFDDKIEIHIIPRDSDIEKIKNHCTDTHLLHFHYHRLTEIENSLKCYTQEAVDSTDYLIKHKIDYSNGIYSFICASIKLPVGNYGNAKIFLTCYQQLCANSLKIAGALILIISLLFSLSYITESHIYDDEAIMLNNQAAAINKDYQKQLSDLEHKLQLAQIMQSSVLLTEKIRNTKSVSPQNFMVDVSRILTISGTNDTQISKLSWHQNQFNDFQPENNKQKSTIDYGKTEAINHLARISGFIHVSKISLKNAVNKTNAIADAFNQYEFIRNIRLNKVPVDVRSQSSIENEKNSSMGQNTKNDSIRGQFEIEVIMDARKS